VNTFQNRPPDYTRLSWLDDDTLQRLRRAEQQLRACRHTDVELPTQEGINADATLRALCDALRHPLSETALANATRNGIANDTRAEAAARLCAERMALDQHCSALCAALAQSDPMQFIRALEAIAGAVTSPHAPHRGMGLRTVAVEIPRDPHGSSWACMPAAEVLAALSSLHNALRPLRAAHPLVAAVVALVVLLAVHPFLDGNGRVSRIAFNALISPLSLPQALQTRFIPLKEFFMLSDFGFELRLRYSFHMNEWSAIARYFCDVIALYVYLCENTGTHSSQTK
jgi:Fic family protein